MEGIAPGFMLSVGRLLAYKNLKAVVAAMTELCEHRLVVAGAGPELDRLRVLAGANVTFLGEVDEAELCWLCANCAGLVAAPYEDYGLTPLEAAAHGRPTAALRFGSFFGHQIQDGVTGVFFEELSPTSIADAIRALSGQCWDAGSLRQHAAGFDGKTFSQSLRTFVESDRMIPPHRPIPQPIGASGGLSTDAVS